MKNNNITKSTVITTRKRSTIITTKLFNKEIRIHNGRETARVMIDKSMFGTTLGALSLTKKMGKGIHDSERNRKRKNKKKQKK